MEARVGNKFRLGRKIGSGSFGEIYLGSPLLLNSTMFFFFLFFTFVSIPNIVLWFLLGTHIQTHEEVAIKLVSSLLRFYICFFFFLLMCMLLIEKIKTMYVVYYIH